MVEAAKVDEEARYDGIFVLRTNGRITPRNGVLRYRELLMVDALCGAAKASFDTHPIFHPCDGARRQSRSGARPAASHGTALAAERYSRSRNPIVLPQ